MTIRGGIIVGNGTGSLVAFGGDPDFFCADQDRESLLLSYAFSDGSVHPQINQKLSGNIVFGPIKAVVGMEVLTTLSDQIRLVRGIIETFRARFG